MVAWIGCFVDWHWILDTVDTRLNWLILVDFLVLPRIKELELELEVVWGLEGSFGRERRSMKMGSP